MKVIWEKQRGAMGECDSLEGLSLNSCLGLKQGNQGLWFDLTKLDIKIKIKGKSLNKIK